mmetsp:Transcript_9981/g.20801  ORF Transcript_9981/g.20801 Transcript_9981/m.20801 type:complete len:349 (-) Transcript_9981:184-1230(-)|eukprot:CAMPEP_0197280340 /NCGR_PEP_ID=MMETSP1432-20130617/21360_1 /TAXON_ID=44447 /ORGANISM="Pseudo-nitzschia delicatissima, Strain UNC1205" /LENGTH=348 /DNA_ID=CAMNT_0042747015 /DNA_START=59 /DNA_END=1105 /DNA_ORIENTATION=+
MASFWKSAIVSFGLLLLAALSTALSSNGEASYVSVRALDHYGNAVQLSHAKEAAQRYGRPVVVALVQSHDEASNNSNNKNSTGTTPTNDETINPPSFLVVVSLGTSPILHPVNLPLPEDTQNSLFMCFVGVKGDAHWLLGQVQKHAASVWERYDQKLSAPSMAHVVARLLGRFAGQPEKREWQSSLGLPGKQDEEDDRQNSWSRPLGVQTMILELESSNSQQQGFLIVEPSGRILTPSVKSKSGKVSLGTMGRGSDKLQEQLARVLSRASDSKDSASSWEDLPPTFEKVKDELIRILLEETNTNSANDSNSLQTGVGGEFMVESYSLDGGRIERQLFRYQNANAYAPI